ncbi:MAG: carbohydrate ABC transporter permease [Clostridia bacterium]|nr:carbohydrate ABC transporter permease [Clostridia bacterium]
MVKSKNDVAYELLVLFIITLVGLVCVIPILFVIAYSLTPMEEMLRNGGFVLIPRKITFNAYAFMIKNPTLISALKVSAIITVFGTMANLVVTMMLAYPLSRDYLPGRGTFIKLIVFTMIFSAGTIPTYLIVRWTGVINTLWALILPSLVTVYNFIVMKAFFEGLPNDLFESARIDGAGEFKILYRIVLPLSLPIVTTISLYYAVSHWNVYTAAILYIQDTNLMPLQVILRRMINAASTNDLNVEDEIPPETMRMAAVCIATAPIVIIYPFIQKYFVKGTLAGAVKG